MAKTLLILGSSRSDGHSAQYGRYLSQTYNLKLIDLNEFNISYYDYQHRNRDDDFIPLIKEALDYQNWIFITPVYWYSMSGVMKVFFDRITDLLTIKKELGRQLRGKAMASISVSDDDDLIEFFHEPFRLSAGYLGMDYLGSCHLWGSYNKSNPEMTNKLNTWFNERIKA